MNLQVGITKRIQLKKWLLSGAAAFMLTGAGSGAVSAAPDAQMNAVAASQTMVPTGPWPAGDERGMANGIGNGTWMRCAYHLANGDSKSYEVSHERSNTMPLSPFGRPLGYEFTPTVTLPGTRHAFNGELVTGGEPGAQGTQMDALGHFAYLDEVWDGSSENAAAGAHYYGGYSQQDVKPTDDSSLLRLGIENVPPIITSAVLLDAKAFLGNGNSMAPGQLITAADIDGMLEAQGLGWRGILPGDVVYIYTGWGEGWTDPDEDKTYYSMGPGLARDAAAYLQEKAVVLIALDNPFTDPVADGQLQGQAMPPNGMDDGLPFAIHHQNLAVAGIHQIQNANLTEMAADKVWTSCTIILPLLSRGHSGSPVRPVAIGAPGQ
ncbi:MAG: cyclase family protein [Rhizobiales bacterium]|nr:cyclase family protein [Hyphomicrobiales bacterium]